MTRQPRSAHLRSAVAVLATTTALTGSIASAQTSPAPSSFRRPASATGVDRRKVPWGSDAASYVPGRIVVVWRRGAEAVARRELVAATASSSVGREPGRGVDVLRLPPGASVGATVRRLEASPLVRFAEPDRIATIDEPNDPFFDEQWALENTGRSHHITSYSSDDEDALRSRRGSPGADIHAPRAWSEQTRHTPTVVAVLDTGVDIAHPDLQDQLWDGGPDHPFHGWDFADHDWDPSPVGTSIENSHGTHVAGIIAAEPNNGLGVAGVCPDCRVMALRIGNGTGLTLGAELKAIDFAIHQGAHIINMSFGSPVWSAAERHAIALAGRAGILVVTAAGNGSADNDVPFYLSSEIAAPVYPASYTLGNIVSVAASNDRDEYGYASVCREEGLPAARCAFTNWGHDSVDLAAPGVDILSTVAQGTGRREFGGDYRMLDGTSMAAPMVSGVAGLVRSEHPRYPPGKVKNAIMNGVDRPRALVLSTRNGAVTGLPERALTGSFTVTQGRLNAFRALGAPTTDATPRSDGNIDGARRMRGPDVGGQVTWPDDANDVYRRRLHRGGRYRVLLDGPTGADLDLWVWKPGTKEIAQFTRGCFLGLACPALQAESGGEGADESVEFVARSTGRYYLQVSGWYSGGRYRLRVERL